VPSSDGLCFYHDSFGKRAVKCQPPCSWSGRGRIYQLNAVGVLIYLKDSVSGGTFLVDTGAAVSVYPHRGSPAAAQSFLSGPGNRPILSWGTVTKKLCFNGLFFSCSFILAAVSRPILDVDFLARHKLLVDAPPLNAADRRTTFLAAVSAFSSAIRSLLAAFPSIISDGASKLQPCHGVEHMVETAGQPVCAKARRLDPDKLKAAEAEFPALEAAGIVRRSDSAWSFPLHMVPKKNGAWRPCGDYHRLNLATVPDRYPLPSLADFANKLHGCKYFWVIDLVKGYHQILMAVADIPKTEIVTPFCMFEYLYMPFGLKNAAQTFQRLMDKIFRRLHFLFTYLNDHLIASHTL
jgi:Reverse transcriptase (RNA-dependent DNA polymerase)